MNSLSLCLAVASKDGISINQHFGHAKLFWIYRVTADHCELLEQRHVANYCHGQEGDQSAMQAILKTIPDCDAILVAKIGEGPTDKLAAIGVKANADYAYLEINSSLLDYAASELARVDVN